MFIKVKVHFLQAKYLHLLLADYKATYGDVVGIKMVWYPAVVLNSVKSIKEAFVRKSQAFTYRPDPEKLSMMVANGPPLGLAFQSGERWKAVRRFSLVALKDFGVGKVTIEMKIIEEARIICDELAKKCETVINIKELIQNGVSNIICSVCFGSRFEYSDPTFKHAMHCISIHMKHFNPTHPISFFPFLRYLPSNSWYWMFRENFKDILKFIRSQIDEHRKSYDKKVTRDFVDLYLEKELERVQENDVFSTYTMNRIIVDLFVAGTETTSSTITWIFLYLLHYPDIQDKCYQEIIKQLGNTKEITASDRDNLPYVNAVIHEIQRVTTVTPLGLPHCTSQDTTLNGYKIPKDTLVFANLHAAHHDKDYWADPEKLNPERWLDSNGQFQMNEAFLVYSTGPRRCVGEMMARNVIFIFVSNLIQKFRVTPEDPNNLPTTEPSKGIALRPFPYNLILHAR